MGCATLIKHPPIPASGCRAHIEMVMLTTARQSKEPVPLHVGMAGNGEGVGMAYGWHHEVRLPETSHVIPLRRQDFGQGDRGQALEELQDSLYYLSVAAFSRPPEGTAGRSNECASHDPAEDIQIRVEGGQVRVEGR